MSIHALSRHAKRSLGPKPGEGAMWIQPALYIYGLARETRGEVSVRLRHLDDHTHVLHSQGLMPFGRED